MSHGDDLDPVSLSELANSHALTVGHSKLNAKMEELRDSCEFRKGQVDRRFDTRAKSAFGTDSEFSADQVDPFAHANQSESGSRLGGVWSEAHSVIGDTEVNRFRSSMHLYIDLCRSAMFRNVVQRLLHDTKQAERDLRG
jgi:hypothetical protein